MNDSITLKRLQGVYKSSPLYIVNLLFEKKKNSREMSNKALLSTKRITTLIQLLILLLALMTMMNGLVSSCTHRVDVTIIRDHFWDGVSNKSKTISCKICATILRSYFEFMDRK